MTRCFLDDGSEGDDFVPIVVGRKLGLVVGRVMSVGASLMGTLLVGDFC